MGLKLYNTLSRSLQEFEPLESGRVRVYGCGPTVYDYAHIGNFRTFMVYDLLHRYLEWSGFDVTFVVNFTDVDDKTIVGAVREGVGVQEYTRPFIDALLGDADALGIWRFDRYPLATHYVPQMVDLVQRLVDNGLAYRADDGSVYFDISEFPAYGRLSGIDLEGVKPGARVAVDSYEKEDARDFALWKAAKAEDEAASAAWDSPWGRGRPGWHLECSVMSIAELGETVDIHLGGEDLIFPHHEDEIAQSEGATGKPFVRYWLHVKHLILEGQKMSKSLGNTVTVRELLDEGRPAAAIRHQLLSAQYRRELNFTRTDLDASARAVRRLLDFEDRLLRAEVSDEAPTTRIRGRTSTALDRFRNALDDDLNAAAALDPLFTFVTEVNGELDAAGDRLLPADRDAALEGLRSMDRVFGLLEVARRDTEVDAGSREWIEGKVLERNEARKARNFALADQIRDELAERGIVLEDGPQGTRWKVVSPAEELG